MTTATDSDSAGPVALIADPLLLERWIRALDGLAGGEQPDQKDWPAYTEAARAHLGAAMVQVVLGGSPKPEPAGPERDLSVPDRRRARRHLEALAESTMPKLPALHRLVILSLILYGVQAKLWDSPLGDQGWFPVVGRALQNLDRDDVPEQLSTSAASWAATAAYLMHEHRPTTGRTADALVYEKAADSVSYLFPDADRQAIADLAAPFTNKNGFPVNPDAVMDFIGMVVQDDPLAEAIDILEANHPAWDVHKHNDRLLHVSGEYRGTFLPAAEALEAMPGTGPAAAWATGSTPGWTLVIRDAGALIRIDKNPQGQVTWWHYNLGNLTRPTGIARDPELGNRARIRHGALNRPFPEAIQAMTAVGASPSDPPTDCPPDAG